MLDAMPAMMTIGDGRCDGDLAYDANARMRDALPGISLAMRKHTPRDTF